MPCKEEEDRRSTVVALSYWQQLIIRQNDGQPLLYPYNNPKILKV